MILAKAGKHFHYDEILLSCFHYEGLPTDQISVLDDNQRLPSAHKSTRTTTDIGPANIAQTSVPVLKVRAGEGQRAKNNLGISCEC